MSHCGLRWVFGWLVVGLAIGSWPAGGVDRSVPAADAPRVLVVLSSEGRDQGRERPGFEMDELSQAWLILADNGIAMDIASPAGGRPEADRFDPEAPYNARFLADSGAQAALADTRRLADVRAEDYAALYVVGGKGPMFDLPDNPELQALIAGVYERGGVVAAVCHGPVALANVRLSDGSLLVAGRELTGFSNAEETVFGKRWASRFPFLLEDGLRERGARWRAAPVMLPNVVVDGRLVTGQNPYSTAGLAEAIVRALGREPVAREPWRDERSMRLVQRLLAGDVSGAQAELAAHTDAHQPELIGMLGWAQLQASTEDDGGAVRQALAIMQLARPYMTEPQLQLAIAEAHRRLGEVALARSVVEAVLAQHPDMPEAAQLLTRLTL